MKTNKFKLNFGNIFHRKWVFDKYLKRFLTKICDFWNRSKIFVSKNSSTFTNSETKLVFVCIVLSTFFFQILQITTCVSTSKTQLIQIFFPNINQFVIRHTANLVYLLSLQNNCVNICWMHARCYALFLFHLFFYYFFFDVVVLQSVLLITYCSNAS